MSTSQVEGVSSVVALPPPSPYRSSLMECVVGEPVDYVPSPGGNEISSNPNENIVEPLVVDPVQMTKAMQMLDVTDDGSDEMDICDDLPDHGTLEEDEIPSVGMRFAKLQLAHDFYVSYVKKVGFATKIRTTTFDKITKEPVNQAIHCNRDRIHGSRVKAPTHKNPISAAGCKARMQLSMHAKYVIQNNDEAGIRPNKTFLSLANEAGGPSNLEFSEKDLRNYITARLQTSNANADVREMMNYFMRMKDINPNFFYAVKLDDECRFRSAVWVDARCRASYEYYGDVVSLDSTYSTNRHGLPFASFVGVNHHGKSTLLGCALLGNKKIPSYEWVFTQWLTCMGTTPQCIITDQCRSMYGAIRKALPNTRHRWCIWRIMKKFPQKLGGYRRYGELYPDLRNIVFNSRTEEAFERKWFEFMEEYNLHDNTWLSDLYDDRRMWVPLFFKGEFWAAMRSTQKSESMHAFYGGILHSKTSLVQFVHEYDNVLGAKEQRELEDDAVDSRG
ncbi:protein FAR1-RELATED SEQUENCE 5-like [Arachis stenosperma]|uniref:protein FAR1-RELATED SEQUENCE 5-like n=1 Tax=Arachis stenosperma TaxID=217475 RepID=UPI0025ACBB4C|nr:protein FAR1-RELATED SEQUENCE 5-like [Arachis stenosperma]